MQFPNEIPKNLVIAISKSNYLKCKSCPKHEWLHVGRGVLVGWKWNNPRADAMACDSTGPVLLGRLPWPVQSQGPGCCGRDLGQRSHGCFPATAARTYVSRNGLFAQYSPVPCVASTNSPAFWKARHIRAYVVLGVYNPNKLQAQLKLHRDYIIAI